MQTRHAEFCLLLIAACLLAGLAHAGNPCEAKRWNGRTVLALNPGDGDDHGIGGTGHGAEDYGIGGTGRSGDGIGGTGITGVVAGFASICVNGLEIHYTPATPTWLDGVGVRPAALALGQIVAVNATALGGGEYRAEQIAIVNAVVGEVETVAGDSLTLLGQQVYLDASEGIRAGMRLAIAGERLADGAIRATRIAPARADAVDSVLGIARQVESGRFYLGALEVRVAPERTPGLGEEVLVRGQMRDGVLRGEQVIERPLRDFQRPLQRQELPTDLRPRESDRFRQDASVPEKQRLEVSRPELSRPEVSRPEVSRPDIPRPTIERPRLERPERPRIGR